MIGQQPEGTGWIEVICGSMYSGKTEELIRRLKRAAYGKKKIQVFKPTIDDRYHAEQVVSHSRSRFDSRAVRTAAEVLEQVSESTDVVGIDEVQFFGPTIVDVVQQLANRGKRVICAGLDQDYLSKPFEPMPQLLAIAEYITKELAICVVCGNPANRSQRLQARDERVLVGGAGMYEARCRRCHQETAAEATPQTIDLFGQTDAE